MLSNVKTKMTTKAIQMGRRTKTVVQLVLSVRGQAHQTKGLPNQDFAQGWIRCHQFGLACSDGLGSCSQSHHGSKLAVLTAKDILTQNELSPNSKTTAYELVFNWRQAVLKQASNVKPFDSTMLFAAIEAENLLVGKVGDGIIQWKLGSTMKGELVEDEQLFGNLTHSLAMRKAENYFKLERIPFHVNSEPISVLLATDGISSDLKTETRQQLIDVLTNTLLENGPSAVFTELKEWIVHWLTPMHSDDRTIAFMAILDKEVEHAQ